MADTTTSEIIQEIKTPPAPEDLHELSDAKSRFIDAARNVDFLKPAREHPFLTVGVAAAVGLIAGSAMRVKPGHMRRAASFLSGLQPVLLKAGQSLAAVWASRHAAKADETVVPEVEPAPHE